MTETQEKIATMCDEIKEMLIKKNQDYGNSFADEFSVFSKTWRQEALNVRIDDKLKRIKTLINPSPDTKTNYESLTDTVSDLVGYLILWLVLDRLLYEQQVSQRIAV